MIKNFREIAAIIFTTLGKEFDRQSLFFCAGFAAVSWGLYLVSLPLALIVSGSFIVLLTTWGVFKR